MALHLGSTALYHKKKIAVGTTKLLFMMMNVSAKSSILHNVYTLLQPEEITTVLKKNIELGKTRNNQSHHYKVSEPSVYTQTLNMQSNLYNSSTHLLLKL